MGVLIDKLKNLRVIHCPLIVHVSHVLIQNFFKGDHVQLQTRVGQKKSSYTLENRGPPLSPGPPLDVPTEGIYFRNYCYNLFYCFSCY